MHAPCPEHVLHCHGHDLHDYGMGHSRPYQPPTRHAPGPRRGPRGAAIVVGRRRKRRHHIGHALPQACDQGGSSCTRADELLLPRETMEEQAFKSLAITNAGYNYLRKIKLFF